jgi:hypothetical protein
MQEKLARAIDKEINSKISSKSRATKDVIGIVKKELAFIENLNSLPPSSVEPERVFSGYGRTVAKIRSFLHDDSVDMLTFLRGYFKTENDWLLIEKEISLIPGASTGIPGPIKSSIRIPVPKKWSDTAYYTSKQTKNHIINIHFGKMLP